MNHAFVKQDMNTHNRLAPSDAVTHGSRGQAPPNSRTEPSLVESMIDSTTID